MMMNAKVALATVAGVALAMAVLAPGAAVAQQHRVAIPFADIGTILNWQPDGYDAVMIENSQRKWFRASFWAPCYQLPFVDTIAFVTEPNGDLDRYSSILVEGDRCWFKDFTETAAPPTRTGRRAFR